MSDSMWKKEISFKKKPKPDADPDAFDLPKQSFLKKEISFSRKPKEPKEPKAAKESIWKKDLSLGKKKDKDRASEIERLVEQAAQAVEPVALPVEPVALPQPTELAEAFVAAMPEPDLSEPAEPVTLAVVPEPPSEPAPFALAPVELPPDLNAVELPVESPAVPDEPVASWPEPELHAEPALEVVVEPWLAEPELPPVAAAAPILVHPPVAAADLPPLEAPEKKTPFWKKEFSVSRKPKAEKAAKAPKEKKPARVPKEKGAPFWKKELSLGRKAKAAAVDAPTEQLPAAPKTPLLKRKLSLSLPKLPSRGGVKVGHSSKKLVGLKIGASQIAAARISNNGVAELQQLARDPLAAGVIVAGELRDPEALGDALKVFFARHKLPKKGVRLGIASNRIGVRILEIVGVEEEKQLANAVQFRAQEALPIPLDEAVLDYRVLEESVDAEGQKVKRVLLVVAYRELVDRYVSACRKAGINLAGIDLEAFALLRALGAPADREGSALVAVAIGHDRSTFAV